MLTGAACHRTATVAAADKKRSLEHRRKDDEAFGLINQVLRNVIGDVHDFFDHLPAILQTFGFLLIPRGQERQRKERQRH